MHYIRKLVNYLSKPKAGGDVIDGKILWEESGFGRPGPEFHVRAPGRVNIIGEHIDHQNYRVLPCAVEKSINIFLSVVPKTEDNAVLEIRHTDSKTFTSKKFDTLRDVKIDKEHHWTNYIVASYYGMTEYYLVNSDLNQIGTHPDLMQTLTEKDLAQLPSEHLTKKSVRMLVTGNLPMAAGLSSSSALVVCAAMCFCTKNAEDPKVIASICANCERYVGTAGGGMDQAAICLCNKNEAQWIGFHPLTTEPIKLPPELAIVVANTCREAPKVKNADKMYNKRVFELKTACFWLAQQFAPEIAQNLDGQAILNLTLRDVLKDYVKLSEDEFLDKLSDCIPDKVYNKEDMDRILGEERRNTLLRSRCGFSVWENNDDFYLYNRIKHVLTENNRVTEFVGTCRTLENEKDSQRREFLLKSLGEVLNASGKSLKEDFDASCDEIEELCAIARDAGALGSRLTGAGWGGCTISLIPSSALDDFIAKVKKMYYAPYISGAKKKEIPLEDLPSDISATDQVLFATTPAQCAKIIPLKA